MHFRGQVNEPAAVTVAGNTASVDAQGNFDGTANVTTGSNTVSITATDANGNSRTNNYQVAVPSGVSKTISYDLNGDLTSDGDKTYEWDSVNRLTAITYSGSTNRTEFTYDGLSRRKKVVEKTGSTVTSTKQFIWVGDRIAEERDGNNSVTRRYFAQGEDRIGNADAGVYYYTRDHLGIIHELTDAAGTLHARYDYDPFGNTTKVADDLDLEFGYTGHYHHAASNLYLAPYRAYDPTIGRWISRDPIAERGGLNLYGYVANNTLNRSDPLGLQAPVPGPAPTPGPYSPDTPGYFRYYGNWGGPGWTGGQWYPYETLSPQQILNLVPPIDRQDQCYKEHDLCYSRCRVKNGCTSGNPSKEDKSKENECEKSCDYGLAICLDKVQFQNLRGFMGWSFFSWRSAIR